VISFFANCDPLILQGTGTPGFSQFILKVRVT
jgi:hypothetical protein